MTAVNRATLYSYFTTGARPTQQQFANLIDSTLNIVEASGQAILSDVSAMGSFAVSGAFEARSGSLFRSDVNVSGNLAVGGSLSITSQTIAALTVTGQSTLNSVTISGIASAQAINAAGNIKTDGTLTVGGATVLASAKGVTPTLGTSTTDLATTAFANPASTVSAAGASVKFPSTFSIKAGVVSAVGTGGGGDFSVVYPAPFSSSTIFATFIGNTNDAAGESNNFISSFSAAGFNGRNTNGVTINVNWLAVGF